MAYGIIGMGRGMRDNALMGFSKAAQIENQNRMMEENMKQQEEAAEGATTGSLMGIGLQYDLTDGGLSSEAWNSTFGNGSQQAINAGANANKAYQTADGLKNTAQVADAVNTTAQTAEALNTTAQTAEALNTAKQAADAAQVLEKVNTAKQAADAAQAANLATTATTAATTAETTAAGASFGPWGALAGLAAGVIINSLF
ncbi:hypothetical protein [Ferrimonas balearica]|uniref:hypothetical protein n=1 Tax=Ferrimonas balearica TaxID=44012 RepID=UPI001F30789E|nr:hypothetical protein [Ferrimonas balearica]MBY6093864.1 hypothetical protein [Ferrimonas balearica]